MACVTAASALGAASFLALPAFAQSYRIDNTDKAKRVHMRQAPSHKSPVVAYIPPGSQLTGTGKCDAKWCEVRFRDRTGWVFRRYLSEGRGNASADRAGQGEREQTVAALPKPGNEIPADLQDVMLRLNFAGGQPVSVYAFPSDRLPAAARITPDTPEVEDLSTCTRDYCYIRSGDVVGWIPMTAIDRTGVPAAAPQVAAREPAATEAPARPDGGTAPARALNNTVPTATQATGQIEIAEGPGSIEVKSYSLAGLSDDASLPVRERPEDNAAVVGWIPGNASSVEGMRKCVMRWCLVRYEQVTGWVTRRHLADETGDANRRYQVNGVALWGALDVMDYPGPGAGIIGHIPSYATGIVPIGSCDKDWCHIRYLGIAGWVSAKYLTAQR